MFYKMVQFSLFLISVWLLSPAESNTPVCARKVNQTAPCLVQGMKYDFDKILYDGSLEKSSIPMFRRDEYFRFPLKTAPAKWHLITFVEVTNRMAPEAQGSVTLTEGGVGHETMTLHVVSLRGVGYSFRVRVFGVEAKKYDSPVFKSAPSNVSRART